MKSTGREVRGNDPDHSSVGDGTQGRVSDTDDRGTRPSETLNGVPEGVKGLRQWQYARQFLIKPYKTKKDHLSIQKA